MICCASSGMCPEIVAHQAGMASIRVAESAHACAQVIFMTGWAPHPSQTSPKTRGSANASFHDIARELGGGEQKSGDSAAGGKEEGAAGGAAPAALAGAGSGCSSGGGCSSTR